jgi:glycerol kinase
MTRSTGIAVKTLKVDGGASANNLLMQFQADILGILIERPVCVETTALGAAYLCGLALGVYSSLEEIKNNRIVGLSVVPNRDDAWRCERIKQWKKAARRSLGWR